MTTTIDKINELIYNFNHPNHYSKKSYDKCKQSICVRKNELIKLLNNITDYSNEEKNEILTNSVFLNNSDIFETVNECNSFKNINILDILRLSVRFGKSDIVSWILNHYDINVKFAKELCDISIARQDYMTTEILLDYSNVKMFDMENFICEHARFMIANNRNDLLDLLIKYVKSTNITKLLSYASISENTKAKAIIKIYAIENDIL